MKILLPAIAALLALAACAPAATRSAPAPVTSGEQLLRAMHDRYEGRWYRTLSFTQRTTFSPPGQPERVEMWKEYALLPGRLRIERGPAAEGRGAIYTSDSTFIIQRGQVARRMAARNPLLILGFDVYAQPPERTAAILREEGFAMTPVRMESWQGRPAYVVGAPAGDLRGKQFWVDAERMVFVRMLGPAQGDSTRIEDVRFNHYQPAGRGWIAPEVEVLVNGARVFFEEYSDIRTDEPLDPALWIPERWSTAPHP